MRRMGQPEAEAEAEAEAGAGAGAKAEALCDISYLQKSLTL